MLNTNLDYHTDLELKYGELQSIMDWCRNHIKNDWDVEILRNAGQEPGTYRFGFRDEKDFVTFLVWKK